MRSSTTLEACTAKASSASLMVMQARMLQNGAVRIFTR